MDDVLSKIQREPEFSPTSDDVGVAKETAATAKRASGQHHRASTLTTHWTGGQCLRHIPA